MGEPNRIPPISIDVPDPSDALEFGTQGVTFRARKPA